MVGEKCKRIECHKPPARGQVYCSRECSPYGYMCSPIKNASQRKDYQAESFKPKTYSSRQNKGIPQWLARWRAERRIDAD